MVDTNVGGIEFEFNIIKEKIYSLSRFLDQNEELINKKINVEKKSIEKGFSAENLAKKIESFKKKYSKFKNLNRFCIPIIGECNSGKTTFMNYLLHQKDLLETDQDINTRFILIIRHDPSLPFPKIYETKLKIRDSIYYEYGDEKGNYEKILYNFEEGEEIQKDNIKNYIKKKNEKLKNKNTELINYFLIMKINIPIFNKPKFAPYANLFDLMDVPGLNDNNKTYLNELLPLFVYNIAFCFFIFDSTQYSISNKTYNNVTSLFKENENNIINNSIFILNKYDLPEDKVLTYQSFNDFINETLNLQKIEYIPLSSEQLLLNLFKYKNFLNYTEYIFKQPPDENFTSSNEHLKLNLEKDFKIEKIDENQEDPDDFVFSDEGQQIEYKIFKEKMETNTKFDTILNSSDYFYYKKYFKSGIKSQEIDCIENELSDKIFKSLEKSINSYTDFSYFEDLTEEILKYLDIEKEKFDEIKRTKTNVKNKEIISLKRQPIEILDSLNKILEKIKVLKDNEYIKGIYNEYLFFKNYIQKEVKLRIPTIGIYSSGKSSLINNIIGKKLLPVSTEICTNIGIIIKYTGHLDEVCLQQARLQKSENHMENYYYFQDINDPIYTKFNNLYEIISLINNAYKYENKFVEKLILFIKKLEEINNDKFKDIIILINDLLLFKENNLSKLEKLVQSLEEKNQKSINEIYSDIKIYLSSILKSKKEKKINEFLRNYKNKNEEEIFLKLTVNLKLFDDLDITDEEKKEIEFIDFPGLNCGEFNLMEKRIIEPIIKFSNGFLFVSKPSININENSTIISQTIEQISNRKILDMSFDSFLFVITHYEELKNIDLKQKIKDIKNIIFSGDLYGSKSFYQAKFLITKFSNVWYQKYLEKQKYISNIKDLYSYLEKQIKNFEIEDIKYIKNLKTKFKEQFFNNLNLNNEKEFENFYPSDNELKKYQTDLIKNLNLKKIDKNYEDIIDEIVKLYLFYIKNIEKHKYYEKDFKLELKKLFINSKKSYNKSLENSIINFILFLQNKLEKMNNILLFKRARVEIENKKKKEEKDEEIRNIKELFSNTTSIINQKIKSFKDQFNDEINSLTINILNGRNENEIDTFVSNWNEKKKLLQDDIQHEIKELALKIGEKIKEFNINEDEFQSQNNIPLFNLIHLTEHGIAFGIHGGLGITYFVTSIVIPGIGFILAGAGILIHSSIFAVNYFLNKKEKKNNLINNIGNYSSSFNDRLNIYESDITQELENLKDSVIMQINDKYLLKKFNFDENEVKSFKEIMELFQKIIEENFKFK